MFYYTHYIEMPKRYHEGNYLHFSLCFIIPRMLFEGRPEAAELGKKFTKTFGDDST